MTGLSMPCCLSAPASCRRAWSAPWVILTPAVVQHQARRSSEEFQLRERPAVPMSEAKFKPLRLLDQMMLPPTVPRVSDYFNDRVRIHGFRWLYRRRS